MPGDLIGSDREGADAPFHHGAVTTAGATDSRAGTPKRDGSGLPPSAARHDVADPMSCRYRIASQAADR
jgi:hypothetical protein